MLITKIQADLTAALKEQNQDALRTLRFLMANLKNLEIEKYPPEKGGPPAEGLPDEEVISVIQKLVKTHKESIEAFKKGGRDDLVGREEAELAILQEYLPEQLSEEEIKKMVLETKATGLSDFGKIMGQVMVQVKGRTDGATVSRIVKEILND